MWQPIREFRHAVRGVLRREGLIMDLKTLGNVPYESPKPKHRSWVSSLSRKERKDRKEALVFQSNAFY